MTEQDIARVARAIAQAGSRKFKGHGGATQEIMSEQAAAGQLEAMSNTLIAHTALHPGDRRSLVRAVPAIILQAYIHGHRQCTIDAVERWRERTPDWAGRLEQAITDPWQFARVATAMADAINARS